MRRSFIFFFTYLTFISYLKSQDIKTHADSLDLEQVVISASRASKSDPVTFQTIGISQINKIYSGQDPAVLLQQLSPSILSYSDAGTDIGNYAQFRMRGISQSRINITLNGVPLNDMVDQGVYFSNFSDFGNSVESIQVQRGVSASSIGVASYGGAINFESTNIFKDDQSAQLQITTGSFGTLRTSAEVNTGRMKNGFGAYGRLTRTSVDGYKSHSASDSYSFFGSVGYAGNKDVLKLTGFMGKTQNDQSYLPVLFNDIAADPKTNYNHPNDTDDFEQELLQLQYTRSFNQSTTGSTTIYYSGARGIFPFSIDNTTQFVYGLKNDHYGLLSNLTYHTEFINLKGGLQFYKFKRSNYEYLAPSISEPYDRDQTKKNELSAFGKINYQVRNFSFYGDIQFRSVLLDLDADKELGTGLEFDKQWVFLNWVGGINYKMNSNQSLYLSYGRSGREPTRSDIRNGVSEEEYVNDLELGWKIENKKWQLSSNIFHMTFENEISNVGALMERSYMEIRQNVPESRRSGLELEFAVQPATNIHLTLNGAYLNTNVSTFKNGSETFGEVAHIFSPKIILRPQIEYQLSSKIEWILSARHASSSFMELANLPNFQLPSHTVFNSQINFRFTKSTSLSIMLNNIFDELYFTDGAPVDLDFDGIVEGPGYRVQPPRHIYLMFVFNL